MGYACPVCETPQADAEHLANHLAFTAMLGRDDHEAWLDDHAPGWDEDDPETLGERVAEFADDAEYHEVFEESGTGHDHGATFEDELERQVGGRGAAGRGAAGRGDLTGDAREVMAEARAMTERMYDDGDEATEDAEGDDGDADADGDATDGDGNGPDGKG
ncbi:DUF5810 domain-containing protein [Halostella litorea]|uniref:DUF5810 domain-containing protein n=1 Tax=Halostella litorea TaxID=2528831 RepID=UPI001091B9E9|nr:DUF5810 domain-containing protein [Halostella litorea]